MPPDGEISSYADDGQYNETDDDQQQAILNNPTISKFDFRHTANLQANQLDETCK